ncbi:MAG: methyltransferase domain-containing protein [Bryobacterales bacterium]|nr:methyltransferase domain-containing protein [Bryobacterales bacterium]
MTTTVGLRGSTPALPAEWAALDRFRSTGMNPSEFANIAATEDAFWWFQGMNRMLWSFLDAHLKAQTNGRALEVGCGTGWVSEQFGMRYPRWQIASMDLAPEGLRYARGRGLRALAQGDIRHLPYASQTFDALLALDVIAHLEGEEVGGALEEFARVLRPGGLLLLRASAFDLLRSRHSIFVHERTRVRRNSFLPTLERSGFEPIRHTYANSLLLPVALLKFRVWEPLTNSVPQSGLQRVPPLLNATLRQFLFAEAAWIRRGGSFPVGQSLWVLANNAESAP